MKGDTNAETDPADWLDGSRSCGHDRSTATSAAHASARIDGPVKVEVFAPRPGDAAGEASKGFVIDLAAQYPSLASSGANLQLTGPAAHQNQAPFPGAFSPGADEKLPGLIVLLSTSTVGARNAQKLAERRSGEVDVLLLWHPDFDRIELCVLDLATGVSLHVDVPPGKALDAFNHPYAYVTQRTPDTRRETDSATTR